MDSWSSSFRGAALAVMTCALAASPVIAASVSVLAPAAGFVEAHASRVSHPVVHRIARHAIADGAAGRFLSLAPHTVRRSEPAAARIPVVDAGGGAAGAAAAASAASALSVDAGFPVMSLDSQISALGSGQNVAPPDTQLAAGPTSLLETVNGSGSVWSKAGSPVITFDLAVFFSVPSGSFFSDPRVLYDAPSGRWFVSGLSFTPPSYGSKVYLAVSSGSDPSGAWTVYSTASTSNVLHDQPKIGVSADKVIMSWNDFQNASSFLGESTYVWEKSQLLAGAATVNIAAVVDDGTRDSLVPVQALGYAASDTNAYVVYNNSHCFACSSASIGMLTVVGTPLQSNVSWSENDLSIPSTSTAPSADQPGAAGSIATNDDRFLNAVLRGGTLWTAGNDACLPNGDSTVRPCARFIAVTVSSLAVAQDFDLAATGAGVYYPAPGLDASGDMLAAYSISSTAVYPSVRVIGESGGTVTAGQTVRAGEALYDDTGCYNVGPPSRWGDYSSAAADPSAAGEVWVAGEYAATSTLAATSGCAWGTYTAELSIGGSSSPGPVAAVSPTSIVFKSRAVGTRSTPHKVTVTNTGTADLVIAVNGVTITDPTDFVISSNTCSNGATTTVVAPGASCTFAVTFAPASIGTFTALVGVDDNAPDSPQTVALSGKGTRPRH